MRYLQKVIRPLVNRINEEGRRYSEAHGGEDPQLPNYQLMLYKGIHVNEASPANFKRWAGRDEH